MTFNIIPSGVVVVEAIVQPSACAAVLWGLLCDIVC